MGCIACPMCLPESLPSKPGPRLPPSARFDHSRSGRLGENRFHTRRGGHTHPPDVFNWNRSLSRRGSASSPSTMSLPASPSSPTLRSHGAPSTPSTKRWTAPPACSSSTARSHPRLDGYVQGLGSRVLLLVDGVPANQGDRGGINWTCSPSTTWSASRSSKAPVPRCTARPPWGCRQPHHPRHPRRRPRPRPPHRRELRRTPHDIWKFRNSTGLEGGGDVTASWGRDPFRGALSLGARHSDGYRQQDEHDHCRSPPRAVPARPRHAARRLRRLGQRPVPRAPLLVRPRAVRRSRRGLQRSWWIPRTRRSHRFRQGIRDRRGLPRAVAQLELAGARLVAADRLHGLPARGQRLRHRQPVRGEVRGVVHPTTAGS